VVYERSQRALGRPLQARLGDTAAAMALGLGMSVSQTRAVFAGLGRHTGSFVRTPKRGDAPVGQRYRARLSGIPGLELAFALWFGWGLFSATRLGNWGSLPFLFLFFFGFGWVGVLSLRHRYAN
jgi:hypothetical protein